MEKIRPKIVGYEKNYPTKNSMEHVNLHNLEETEQEISELREKISGIDEFITDVEIRIRLAKKNKKKLTNNERELLEDAKETKEKKYISLAIFINHKIALENEERRRNQQMERASKQSTQQVIAKKNKKKTFMVGGVIDELPLNIPESLEKIIYAKKIKEEIVSMKEKQQYS